MAKSNHKQIEYVYGSEMVVVNSMRKGNNKRWVVTAYDSNVPPNQAVKKLSPDSGRTINIDLFSPQDGSEALTIILTKRYQTNPTRPTI